MDQPIFDAGMMSAAILSPEEIAQAAFLPEEEQEELIERLHSHYDKFKADVKDYHDKLDSWHKLYEAQVPSDKEWPWEGASNYSVPLIRATIDSMHARISKSVFDVDPIWLMKPRTAKGVPVARVAEAYLDYWADTIDLPRTLDAAVQGMLIDGVSVVKVDWMREYAPPAEDGSTVLAYDAPSVSFVPIKDFVLVPADSPTIEEATYVGHRVYLTRAQLEKRQEAGVYFNVDKLFDAAGSGDRSFAKGARTTDIVAANTSNSKYPEVNQYEVVEFYGPYDFGEGPEQAVMTFSPNHKILLRVEPYTYEHGRPPYVDFTILPRPNFFWGYSFAEILESPQEELTAIHNTRADALALSISAPILRKIGGTEWDPDVTELKPGVILDVMGENDITQMPIAPVHGSVYMHENDILSFVERVTGLSDYHMGRNAETTRTATEVNRVSSEGLVRLDAMVSRFQHGGMKQLGWMLWWMLYQYRPFIDYFYYDGEEYSIVKTDKGPTENGLMMFEIQPHGILSDVSKEARRQQKLMLFNTVAGVLSQHYPDGIQAILRDIFHEFDVKNADEVLGPPWSVIQQQLQQAFQEGMQQGQQQVMEQLRGAGAR